MFKSFSRLPTIYQSGESGSTIRPVHLGDQFHYGFMALIISNRNDLSFNLFTRRKWLFITVLDHVGPKTKPAVKGF